MIIPINKPAGITSHTVVNKLRRFYGIKKIGHAGTLDPFATGVLILLVGRDSTKRSEEFMKQDKIYRTKLKLGFISDTYDKDGVIQEYNTDIIPTQEQLESIINQFIGEIEQIPPMYSALKFEGRPLYEYAREGIEIERKSRQIKIFDIKLINIEKSIITIEVLCSKGTYIRTLAEDIGQTMGCGAHLKGLERTQTGNFQLSKALSIEALEAMPMASREKALMPIDVLLEELSSIKLNMAELDAIKKGQSIDFNSKNDKEVRLYSPSGQFVGVGQPDLKGRLFPKRLIAKIL